MIGRWECAKPMVARTLPQPSLIAFDAFGALVLYGSGGLESCATYEWVRAICVWVFLCLSLPLSLWLAAGLQTKCWCWNLLQHRSSGVAALRSAFTQAVADRPLSSYFWPHRAQPARPKAPTDARRSGRRTDEALGAAGLSKDDRLRLLI